METAREIREFGDPLPPNQKVEAVGYLSNQEMQELIFKAAAAKAGLIGSYIGHVSIHSDGNTHSVTATVSFWKSDVALAIGSTSESE